MSALDASSSFRASPSLRGAFRQFADELYELACALLNPRQVIADVEEMRALQVEAQRIETAQPARAALLRRRAAHIGRR